MIRIYKTTVAIEILHTTGTPAFTCIGDIVYEITEGGCSGLVDIRDPVEITPRQLKVECRNHGVDFEFFSEYMSESDEDDAILDDLSKEEQCQSLS